MNQYFCESCVQGKQKRVRVLNIRREFKVERLELVYIYMWGPFLVLLFGEVLCDIY